MPSAARATTPAGTDDIRHIARTRAASVLGLGPEGIEDDLVDFLVTDGDALLRARAGSGKTTALTIKAAHLVHDRGVAPGRIMMLTFNNAAARSLESRLARVGLGDVRVRTFHAFGQRVVRAHFGGARRCVFDDTSEDGQTLAELMDEALDEVITDRFYHFCASKMRTRYDKRRDYVEGVGRDALLSAVNFMRARGYGLQNRLEDAWDRGPIVGNAMKVILEYEGRLKDARLLDGVSVLQAASWTLEREIARGTPRMSDAHDVEWVFIDEFQDVSAPYMRLVAAIRDINGAVHVQGVGDDWQAINGFAGASLEYFHDAEAHMDAPVMLNLLRNRRSGAEIVAWGNTVMAQAGHAEAPAVAAPSNGTGAVHHARVSAERDVRFIAERLAAMLDPDAGTAALIARKWKVGDHGLSRLRKLVSEVAQDAGWTGTLTGITAHGSKGLEYDQVLLLDDGSFPLDHPSRPILEPLIPAEDYLREEACLKHVAGTRARHRLDVVSM